MNRLNFNKILGTNKEFDTEHLLLHAILFNATLISALSLVINIYLHLNTVLIILTLVTTIFLAIIFWMARMKKWHFLAKWLTSIIIFFIVDIMWFYNSGSYGPILLIQVVIFSLFIYLWDSWQRILIISVFVINSIGQFILEFNYPSMLIQYANNRDRIIDVYTGLFIYLCLSGTVMIYLKKLYQSEQKKAMKSDQLKSSFLANMSHEIRTPMNGIIGFSQLLKRANLSEEKRTKYINTIIESSNQLMNIVNDILDISKIETGQVEFIPEPVNLQHTIESIIDFHKSKASEKNLRLFWEPVQGEQGNILFTDGAKLRQILNNLVSNAIKFTNEGYVKISYTNANDFIEFQVEDTGIGIEKSNHKEIFDHFRQLEHNSVKHNRGTGLGLTICKSLVELLGGQIWLESELGKGTVFHFTISTKFVQPERDEKIDFKDRDLSQSIPFKGYTILIAEDDDINFRYLNEVLKECEINVIRAIDGYEAIKICQNIPNINMVLMDIKMPLMDGYNAALQIKQFKPHLPIIAQTAYPPDPREFAQNKIKGFDACITKPMRLNELLLLIEKYYTNCL
jgi:signal transduction histidine kinase/CheY-like chemotaxis protein